jgi:hypothetical protein
MPKAPPKPTAAESAERGAKTAAVQKRVAGLADDLQTMAARLLEMHTSMRKTWPAEEVADSVPMSLAYRVCEDLRATAPEVREVADSMSRVAKLTSEQIRAEWLRERTADVMVDGQVILENLREALAESDKKTAAKMFRSVAAALLTLAARIEEMRAIASESSGGEDG